MECRIGCGACCITISISSPVPGMPKGKPAGVRCAQLTPDSRCRLYGHPDRPEVCVNFQPDERLCGRTTHEAMAKLAELEHLTSPELVL